MTKSPLGGEKKTGKNPTDRAKLGAKRSLLVEQEGIPVGLAVEGTNRNNMKLTGQTLASIPGKFEARRRERMRCGRKQNLCMDKGYGYEEVRRIVEEFGFEAHIRCRGEEKEAKKRSRRFKARRWVVERTHSWMNRFRRILIRWEKKAANYEAMLHFACASIVIVRLFG